MMSLYFLFLYRPRSLVSASGRQLFPPQCLYCTAQREGMGLLEYHQAMPSLRDLAHDGVLCIFSKRSAPDRDKWCGPSVQAAWIVHPYKITPCWVTLLLLARRAAVLDQPSSFGLIRTTYPPPPPFPDPPTFLNFFHFLLPAPTPFFPFSVSSAF